MIPNLNKIVGQFQILGSNAQGYGIGNTLDEAKQNCRRATQRVPKKFFIIPRGMKVLDVFNVEYPADAKFCMTEI